MSNFDKKLERLLNEEDEQFIANSLEETGYYSEALNSLKGRGSGMHVLTWAGIMVFSAILLYSIWKFFQVDTVRDQIMFATLAVLANSAQIALKMWFNMRLNRRAVIREIKRLQLAIARD